VIVKSRRLWSAGYVAQRETKHSFRILVGTPVVKRSLGKLQRRLENNIKIHPRKISSEDMKQFHQTQIIPMADFGFYYQKVSPICNRVQCCVSFLYLIVCSLNYERNNVPTYSDLYILPVRRRRGRPSIRWMDSVIADLATMGIRGWRTKVADRDAWRTVVNEAKTHQGL
jgi:hypothetical protein